VNLQVMIASLLALAVALATLRMLLRWRAADATVRPQPWRAAFLLGGQAASAALLYFTLFPPAAPAPAGALTVLTGDAANAPSVSTPGRLIALPEAGTIPTRWLGAERVPDLGTALRRYPATRTIHVVGAGLVARDRDALQGRVLRFHPAPLPAGLVELERPGAVAAGRSFAVRGRANALPSGRAELLDPAGRRLDRAILDDTGGFELHGSTRSAGLASYTLRLRDGRGRIAERVAIPMQILPARRLRMLVLAGAPNAELKFLRRWAMDAGMTLNTRIDLGAGLQIASRAPALDPASLDKLDLLIVDERSWRSLGAGQRGAVLAAVDHGLGLLLRLSVGAGADERTTLRALGFATSGVPRREVRLGAGFARAGDAVDALPTITRSPLQVSGEDTVVALADAAGTPLSVWRARGRGRIGVAALDDSYRLALAGRADAHGELWSRLASVLTRAARGEPAPSITVAPPDQRSVACGLRAGAQVATPDGRGVRLQVDPRTGAAACAGFWASASGWHRLRQQGQDTPFFIPTAGETPALRAAATRDATRLLAGAASQASPGADSSVIAGPRWPWFVGWLLLTGLLWWLERSRHGLRATTATGTSP
jgi:hypothetical protein